MAQTSLKTRKAYRQGELLFIPLGQKDMATLSPDSKGQSYPNWKKMNTTVLREGEATGHKHEIVAENTSAVTVLAPASRFIRSLPDMETLGTDDRLMVLDEPVEIVHPEHRSLQLGKGMFLMIVQREYDEVTARRVTD